GLGENISPESGKRSFRRPIANRASKLLHLAHKRLLGGKSVFIFFWLAPVFLHPEYSVVDVHSLGPQRKLLGRVPILRKRMTDTRSALKTKPRGFSLMIIPSSCTIVHM